MQDRKTYEAYAAKSLYDIASLVSVDITTDPTPTIHYICAKLVDKIPDDARGVPALVLLFAQEYVFFPLLSSAEVAINAIAATAAIGNEIHTREYLVNEFHCNALVLQEVEAALVMDRICAKRDAVISAIKELLAVFASAMMMIA